VLGILRRYTRTLNGYINFKEGMDRESTRKDKKGEKCEKAIYLLFLLQPLRFTLGFENSSISLFFPLFSSLFPLHSRFFYYCFLALLGLYENVSTLYFLISLARINRNSFSSHIRKQQLRTVLDIIKTEQTEISMQIVYWNFFLFLKHTEVVKRLGYRNK